MDRRGFLKVLGVAAAAPVVAGSSPAAAATPAAAASGLVAAEPSGVLLAQFLHPTYMPVVWWGWTREYVGDWHTTVEELGGGLARTRYWRGSGYQR